MSSGVLMLWVCVAATPGAMMLVALIIYYRGCSRTAPTPHTPIEPFARGAFDELGRLQAHATGHSGDTRAPESNEVVSVLDNETIDDQANRAVAGQTPPSATKALTPAQFAEKLLYLADLTTHMLERRETLNRTAAAYRRVANDAAPNRLYLSFTLGDVSFAVSMSNVHSVVEGARLIARPGVAPQARRAIAVDGALVPVIDLGAKLHGHPSVIGAHTKIAVLDVPVGEHRQKIGVVADGVGAILEIPSIEIDPTTRLDSRVGVDFTFGTVMVNDQRVTLLAIGRGASGHQSVVSRPLGRSAEQDCLPT